jgi:hypothetical protein
MKRGGRKDYPFSPPLLDFMMAEYGRQVIFLSDH